MEKLSLSKLPKTEFRMLFTTQLFRSEYQPREQFEVSALNELAQTIRRMGVLEPLLVRPIQTKDHYEIIAGERRWRAAQLASLEKVPCLVGSYSNEQMAQIALIENMVRKNLNPIEEARGVERLIREFNYTHEETASIFGKARTEITNLLRLLKLDERVRELILSGELTESHGKVLAGVSQTEQFYYAKQAVSQSWSIRALEKSIKQNSNDGANLDKKISKDNHIQQLERKLSDHFCSPVHLEINKKNKQKGAVTIYFNSLNEFDGILVKMGYHGE